ncbi:MAG: hypothetical protein ABIJ16_06655, partial [Bacteroidota bacterium]
MTRYIIFSLLTSLLTVSFLSGQDGNQNSGTDKSYVEYLLKVKLDQFREAESMDRLLSDSMLYVIASQHSSYLAEKNLLTSEEDSRKYKTPQKRAETFGATDYRMGEIITDIHYDVLPKAEIISESLYEQIISKPVNHAHILSRIYTITGISVVITPENRVVAVVDLAQTGESYEYKCNASLFPYEKNQDYIKCKPLKQMKKFG